MEEKKTQEKDNYTLLKEEIDKLMPEASESEKHGVVSFVMWAAIR